MALQLALDRDDAGQILVKTALASDANKAFRITYQDGSKTTLVLWLCRLRLMLAVLTKFYRVLLI